MTRIVHRAAGAFGICLATLVTAGCLRSARAEEAGLTAPSARPSSGAAAESTADPKSTTSASSAEGAEAGGESASPGAAAAARALANSSYLQGQALISAGKLAEAVPLFEQALALDPRHGDARAGLGWAKYRQGNFAGAVQVFAELAALEPTLAEGWTGLAYARMQMGDVAGSAEAFGKALALSPESADGLKGLALLDLRSGRAAEAVPLLQRVLEAAPGDAAALAALRRALAESGQLTDRRLRPTGRPSGVAPPAPAPAAGGTPALSVPYRAGRRYFEVRRGGTWQPLLVKGVNLGVALPGRFPSEFPESEEIYRDWLGKIRAMNANAVRLYTLLPPAFYGALAKENRAYPEAPLYLIQGVWVELPPDDDFSDPAWNADYAAEIRRVIDAVHGNIEVAPRVGHASGLYGSDVSAWLLAIILGREWEPFSVQAYDERTAKPGMEGSGTFAGRYVRVASGTPTECWVASTVEIAAAHLAEEYGESRPLAFTNWPTLDPLTHPTEATREEENAILRRRGLEPRGARGPVYDNDAVSVDANKLVPGPWLPAGIFASYHAYPYYPDFMNLDPGYVQARNSVGPSAYAGYLRDLVRYHAGRPVLIAETGVPTSRGISHKQIQGFHHGGHDEKAQAAIDARLARDIQETGCAGVVVFSWIDEWFKRNWLFTDIEIPAERNPLWLNVLDPEQNFGIMEAAAGPEQGGIVLDGRKEDWAGVEPLYPPRAGRLRALYATSDEAYLYLRLDVAPAKGAAIGEEQGTRPWSAAPVSPGAGQGSGGGASYAASSLGARRGSGGEAPGAAAGSPGAGERSCGGTPDAAPPVTPGAGEANGGDGSGSTGGWTYWIGIDTYDRALGDTRLPGLKGPLRVPSGLEFALRLDDSDPRILVDAPYDVGSHGLDGPYASVANAEGRFISMDVEMRLERLGRDGTVYPSDHNDMSPLRRGTTDPGSPRYDSRSDFFYDPAAGVYEIRIPWNLLGVTDPSSRRVLHQTTVHAPGFDTTLTDGFRFYVAAVAEGRSRPADERPEEAEEAPLFTWATWESPRFHLRPKVAYETLKKTFAGLDVLPATAAP